LLVTAIYFLDDETAIFNGRSPNGRDLPAGDNHQPLGNNTLLFSFGSEGGCATIATRKRSMAAKKVIDFLMTKVGSLVECAAAQI
jgi:hypothetical protein